MIKTIAIKFKKPEPMSVTWDLGRRCNYDCSYCESTRHNNYSRHRSFDELKLGLDFIKTYTQLLGHDVVNINFTGGEPTNNPIFFEFANYAKHYNFNLGLTTNGAFSPKYVDNIVENFSWVTVSYHCEADGRLKDMVLENIKRLHRKIKVQVNVMMHKDYWDECINVCEMLRENNIMFNPRPIGDGNITRIGWFKDVDGTLRRTSHDYSLEQQDWYFKHMGVENTSDNKREGTQLGRNCCGGRCLLGKVDDVWQDINLIDTHFKDWYCSINKNFLHIDHETELVYHHQTCQARFNKERGPIGSLQDVDKIYDYVKQNKDNIIVCPNERCGCGMCVPKARDLQDYLSL